jgi:hypothetical protein
MDISKVPPAEVSTVRPGTAATPRQESAAAADAAPAADRADIRPLDVRAALQILLAEVRAGLDLGVDVGADVGADAAVAAGVAQDPAGATPVQTARELVEMFLQALPDEAADPPAWTAALMRAETAMQSGMDRAINVVSQWREVPPAAVDAVKDARALFLSALGDEPQNPLWLRPEWMVMGPLFQRFRRRRRNARRRLTDPDYAPGSLDEREEIRR